MFRRKNAQASYQKKDISKTFLKTKFMPIFKKLDLQNRSKKKQRKRKLYRYKRDHSLSLLHADYMENEGIHVIAYEDNISRKIRSIDEFNNAATDNALEFLKIAGKRSNRSQRFDRIDQYG
jgi:hypothetical protein